MKISIIGAGGNIGSAAAFTIAVQRIADELVMIDNYSPDKLEQYAYDLNSAVTGMDVRVRAGNDEDMQDSNIVLVAAGSAQVVASRLEVLPQNLPIIQKIALNVKKFCPEAIVITATNPVCPLNYGMYLASGLDRKKLLGYSANDSIRFRQFLAEALGVPSSRVKATVIGEHGNTQVLLFSSVRVNGRRFKVSEDIRQQIRQKVANLHNILEPQRIKTGRTAAWTTSIGLAAICRAISKNTREMIPCSVVLDGEYGCRGMGMSVPAVIGSEGVSDIQQLKLDPEEQEGLERSINALNPAMKYVEEFFKK